VRLGAIAVPAKDYESGRAEMIKFGVEPFGIFLGKLAWHRGKRHWIGGGGQGKPYRVKQLWWKLYWIN
jgi:hypothetical protein